MVSLLNKAHLFWRNICLLFFKCTLFKIGFLIRPRVGVGYFDLSFFVDEDVMRPYVTYLPIDLWKILSTAHQAVQQVPKLLFFEVLIHGDPVFYFLREEVREVFVKNLHFTWCTFALPVLPHHPFGWYSCLIGNSKLSLFSKPLIELVTSFSHVFIYFYSGTSMVI